MFLFGGLVSFLITIGIIVSIIYFMNGSNISKSIDCVKNVLLRGGNTPSAIITLLLLGAALIGTWLTIWVGGHLVIRFVSTGTYSVDQVLAIITYVIITSLSFSLIPILGYREVAPEKYMRVGLQAVLITILIFIEQYSSTDFLETLQQNFMGVFGYLILAGAIGIILLALAYVIKSLPKPQQSSTS
jgi:hypothetical protein